MFASHHHLSVDDQVHAEDEGTERSEADTSYVCRKRSSKNAKHDHHQKEGEDKSRAQGEIDLGLQGEECQH